MWTLDERTLKDKILHWDSSYIVCDFPQEEDDLHDKHKTYSDISVHVHHGLTLKEYIERNDWRAHYEKERWDEWYIEWCTAAGLQPNKVLLEIDVFQFLLMNSDMVTNPGPDWVELVDCIFPMCR